MGGVRGVVLFFERKLRDLGVRRSEVGVMESSRVVNLASREGVGVSLEVVCGRAGEEKSLGETTLALSFVASKAQVLGMSLMVELGNR